MAGRVVSYAIFLTFALLLVLPTTMLASSFAQESSNAAAATASITLDQSSIHCSGILTGTAVVTNTGTERIFVTSVRVLLVDDNSHTSLDDYNLGVRRLDILPGQSQSYPFVTSGEGTIAETDPEPATATLHVVFEGAPFLSPGFENGTIYNVDSSNAQHVSITGCPLLSTLQQANQNATQNATKSNCLIATAAFGSDLAPQVQFLRVFRDQNILSTASGSSFMNVFNAWYYSFSPSVADYERGQPWMQQYVRIAIQPLLAILTLSEKGYSSMPGEFGAMSAGLIASAMIGAVYFSPIAVSIKQVRRSNINYRIVAWILAVVTAALIASIFSGNQIALTITSSLFVLGVVSASGLTVAKVLVRFGSRLLGTK